MRASPLCGLLCAAGVFVVPWAFDKASCSSSAKSRTSPLGPQVGGGSPAALCTHFIVCKHTHTHRQTVWEGGERAHNENWYFHILSCRHTLLKSTTVIAAVCLQFTSKWRLWFKQAGRKLRSSQSFYPQMTTKWCQQWGRRRRYLLSHRTALMLMPANWWWGEGGTAVDFFGVIHLRSTCTGETISSTITCTHSGAFVALHRYFLISGLKTLIIWEGKRGEGGIVVILLTCGNTCCTPCKPLAASRQCFLC